MLLLTPLFAGDPSLLSGYGMAFENGLLDACRLGIVPVRVVQYDGFTRTWNLSFVLRACHTLNGAWQLLTNELLAHGLVEGRDD